MGGIPDADRQFAGLCTRLLLEFVEWRIGPEGVADVLVEAGEQRKVSVLLDDASWSSYAQVRRLLEAAGRRLGSPDDLLQVGELPSIGSGTRPEITALLQTYGSPIEMALAVGKGVMGPALEMDFEVVGPADLLMRIGLADGLEPFPELCKFIAGMVPLSIRIFGLQPSEVSEMSCRHRGDSECLVHMAWDETEDLALQLDVTRFQRDLAESRLASFQRTVEEVVSTDDLDTVMGRIVEAATRATVATAFLLEVDIMGATRCYADGIESHRLEEISERACVDGNGFLIVNVASKHRRYGRIVVLDQDGKLQYERPALEGYARLAATALDAALALEEARRETEASRALLELSTSLSQLTSADQLAARLVRAMPAVIDSDCSLVVMVDEGVARIAAHHGIDAPTADRIDAFEIDLDDQSLKGVVVHTDADAPPVVARMMATTDLVALAVAPIFVEDRLVGLLVAGARDRPQRIVDDPSLTVRFSGLAGQAAVALENGRLLDEIRHQSLHDPLTELPNRALFLDRTKQAMARARRHKSPAAILYIDLDGFKEINDTLGHAAGDELLQAVACRLQSAVRESDTVGRLGGDEFVVLTEDASLDAVVATAERILEVLREPLSLAGRKQPITVRASIGIATSQRGNVDVVLRNADTALYAAKAAGKDCFRVFTAEMHRALRSKADVATDLMSALERDEFFLDYQPIFDLDAEVITGVEALLRWDDPKRGVVFPGGFLPTLEETGLIVPVGRWVLHEACRQAMQWHAEGHRIDLSVNASMRQLVCPEFTDHVGEALEASGLPSDSLILEISETAIGRNLDATVAVLTRVKQLGVRLAVDDFGAGYGSFAALRQCPVDTIKIDRSLIGTLADSPDSGEVIHTLVWLANALKLNTLAKGIERRQQLDVLHQEGCLSGQGYVLAPPLPASEVSELLADRLAPQPIGSVSE